MNSINLPLGSPVSAPSGSTLQIEVLERSACAGNRHGTTRLWYNGQPVDTGAARDAGTRFDATIGGSNSNYYLRTAFALSTTAGSARTSLDQPAGSACSAFKSYGTWTITIP